MKKLSLLITTVLALGLGATPAKAIVFGEEVIDASTRYPWVASIWYADADDEYYYPICTGSLIASDVVLTAAHCILNSGTYYVQMGSDIIDGDSDSTFYEIDAVWKNPRYSKKNLVNDIGLLKLTTPQYKVVPMAYATSRDLSAVKQANSFEIMGWGRDQSGETASYLRYTKVSEQSKAARSLYSSKYFNSKTMIAAGKYIKNERVYTGACNGDSGGPLVATIRGVQKVVGVTSWGKKGCNTKAPTVFGNVAYYESDIAKGMATLQRSALVLNRAMPSIVSEPFISGGGGAGSSLTCNTGAWSSNTTSIKIAWSAPYSIWNSTSPSVSLPATTYSDTKYTCIVTGENRNGRISREVSITIPASPYALTYPTIENVGYSITPTLNSTLTCSAPSWRGTGVSSSFTWYASSSSYFEYSNAVEVGQGSSLVMSEAVETAMSGRGYLHCVVVGSNAGGSASASDYVVVYRPFRR